MSDLKPCPFCGGDEQEIREVGDCGDLFSVICNCGSETDFHQSENGAIKQWNNRAQPTIAEFFADDEVRKMIEKTKCGVVTIASLKKFGGLE